MENPTQLFRKLDPVMCPIHKKEYTPMAFASGLPMPGGCPICADEANKKRMAEEKKAAEEKAIALRMKNIGLPLKYENVEFSDFKPVSPEINEGVNIGRQFVENFQLHRSNGSSLVFLGPCGTGKTMLSAAILRGLARQGHTGVYTTVAGMLRKIKGTWNKFSEITEEQALRSFVEPGLLVIDEIGLQVGNGEADQSLINEVIDRRYSNNLPSVLISNCLPEDLSKWVGHRVVSRLQENGGKTVVMFGEDYRLRKPSLMVVK